MTTFKSYKVDFYGPAPLPSRMDDKIHNATVFNLVARNYAEAHAKAMKFYGTDVNVYQFTFNASPDADVRALNPNL
jgi:hypothetical protein